MNNKNHYVLTIDGTTETVEVKDQYNKLPVNAQPDVLYPVTVTTAGNWTASANVNGGQNLSACEIKYYNENKEQINYYTINSYSDGRMYKTFSATTATKYVSISRKSAYATTPVTDLKVEMGNTMTPYYSGGTATATDLLAVGTYQDVQEVLTGNVTRNVGIYVFDGTEGWTATGDTYGVTLKQADYGYVDNVPVICSHFAYSSNSSTTQTDVICNRSGNFGLRILANSTIMPNAATPANRVTDFKTWLATQYQNGTPVIVVYPKSTATTEHVTAQHLNIQAGTNIIEITQASVDNLELEVKYKTKIEEGE